MSVLYVLHNHGAGGEVSSTEFRQPTAAPWHRARLAAFTVYRHGIRLGCTGRSVRSVYMQETPLSTVRAAFSSDRNVDAA